MRILIADNDLQHRILLSEELIKAGHKNGDIKDYEMQENFHKARTLLSSRMDDVRALKRMVSETKETLELKRR